MTQNKDKRYVSSEYSLYIDRESNDRFSDKSRLKAILLGSFVGNYNFGDVLQLKSVIRWYKENTELDPVIVLDVGCIDSTCFVESVKKIKHWFDIDSVILYSQGQVNSDFLNEMNLVRIEHVRNVEWFHLYGGGFLNKNWGEGILKVSEILHQVFEFTVYIVSGQQIEPSFVNVLQEHFQKYSPDIIGCRDMISVNALNEVGIQAMYSFDDAYEAISELATYNTAQPQSSSFLFHFNLSKYAVTEHETYETYELQQISKKVNKVWSSEYENITILQNYHNRNNSYIDDSLGVLNMLEDQFHYFSYSILDLAQLSLHLWSNSQSKIAYTFPINSLVLSSSYHIAVFCAVLGVPCFLQNNNAYYDQKKCGLGLEIDDFDVFLRYPERIDIDSWHSIREGWINRLLSIYNKYYEDSKEKSVQEYYLIWEKDTPIRSVISYRLDTHKYQLQQAQYQLQQAQSELQQAQSEIIEMKKSKFWKIRQLWFRIKKFQ